MAKHTIEVFQVAFPDRPGHEIEHEVAEMFLDLIEEGLATPDK